MSGQVKSGQFKSTSDRSSPVNTGQDNSENAKSSRVKSSYDKTYTWNSSVALLSPTCYQLLITFLFQLEVLHLFREMQ